MATRATKKRKKADTKCLPAAAVAFPKLQSALVCFCWWAVHDSGSREKERAVRTATQSASQRQTPSMRSRSSRLVEAEPERSRAPVSGAQLRAEGRSSALPRLCWGKLQAIRSDVLEEFHKGVGLHLSEGDPGEIVLLCHLVVCLAPAKVTWRCQGGICSRRGRLVCLSSLIDLIRCRRSDCIESSFCVFEAVVGLNSKPM